MLKPCKLTFRDVAGPALFKRTFASGHLPFGRTFWSPTTLNRQPYFAGFVGMENCIFSLCLDVRNFLKLLKKTCLHKGGFQDFFDIHFSLWTFGGSTVKFFSGSQRASHLCSPEKNFTVSPPNVRREKFMSKKSWKPPLCRRVFFNASRNFYIRGKREEQAIASFAQCDICRK